MNIVFLNPSDRRRMIRRRRRIGADRYDEVWEGVYVVSPSPNDEHSGLVSRLGYVFEGTIGFPGLGLIRPGIDVSDRDEGWEKNYRTPDIAIFMNGTTSRNCDTHWVGGPDFVVEVISRNDRSRKKIAFYASIGVRELLLVDRYPWALELYRLWEGRLVLVGRSEARDPKLLSSEVIPLTFRLVAGEPRPLIEVAHADGVQRWSI